MEHDVMWAYTSTLLSSGLGLYLFINHPMNVWGSIAVVVMVLVTLFITQLYVALLKEVSGKILDELMQSGLSEIGESLEKE